MATICFRPPPLPPNKKSFSSSRSGGKKGQNVHNFNQSPLSSTYLSFRDPSDDVVVPIESIEMTNLAEKKTKRSRRVSHTNSLNRGRDCKVMLTRSHSEGNLDKKGLDDHHHHQLSISRYMRVLSGSWKNLLNCKCLC